MQNQFCGCYLRVGRETYEFTYKILFGSKSEVQPKFTGPAAAEIAEKLKFNLK
jgi:hypothetical protein